MSNECYAKKGLFTYICQNICSGLNIQRFSYEKYIPLLTKGIERERIVIWIQFVNNYTDYETNAVKPDAAVPKYTLTI